MDKKYLLYERHATLDHDERESLIGGNPMWVWNDRLLLVAHTWDHERWYFTALDLITNETRPIHFLKSSSKFRQVKIVSLNKDYGFVVESVDDSFCVNLVKLNWAPGEFQLIERFEQAGQFPEIILNCLNPTRFILRYCIGDEYIHKACTLDSGKIEVLSTYESENFLEHYFNDKMFVVYEEDEKFEIHTYNWATKESKLVQIDILPNVEIDVNRVEWVKERLYAAVYFDDTETYGIGYTDLKTKRWDFLDLRTDLRISKMEFFGGNLLVYAAGNDDEDDIFDDEDFLMDSVYCPEFKIYSVPVSHPRSLRQMAWPLVVQSLKRDKSIDDPYRAAAQYLPFNSNLRAPWYSDETALENLDEPATNKQGKTGGDTSIQSKGTAGKARKNKLSQESSEGVPPKRAKFDQGLPVQTSQIGRLSKIRSLFNWCHIS